MNNKITNVFARYVLDSRANPTVEVEITLEDGSWGRAAVPSGASTGTLEAHELRDDSKDFNGKGVTKAVENVNKVISKALIGQDAADQENIDTTLIQLDATPNKSSLGANSILAVSMANIVAHSKSVQKYVYELIPNIYGDPSLPVPFMNILNGGAHADNKVDIQEFMIVPHGFNQFDQALQAGVEIYHTLKKLLKDRGLATNVGDEGGFAPNLNSSEEVLKIIIEAVEKANYTMEDQVSIALDAAASEFYKDGSYLIENQKLSSSDMVNYLLDLTQKFPIVSIEDGLAEDDWDGWNQLTKKIGDDCQLVGDDLFVTNKSRLADGINKNIANSILVKVNQIGTLTETLQTINMAKKSDYTCIISHRSGETEDTTIADLAVATNAGQIKTGSLSRSDRTSKYNQLLRIEEELGDRCYFPGTSEFSKYI